MEQILKKIKTELKDIRKEYVLRLKHINNKHQEILEYTHFYGLNFKKHNLVCRFILQKQENALSFTYKYICDKKNCDVIQEYSFMSTDTEKYPCFTEEDVSKIKELYKFEVVGNIIKNTTDLETQADVLVTAFKKNYKSLCEFVKNQNNNKENPE
ncbi:MAG: hypothetical protein JEZ05_01055 [Tenericutes bacterium]|nr:hypothetical protein [Mycoplasmatota bacterium]